MGIIETKPAKETKTAAPQTGAQPNRKSSTNDRTPVVSKARNLRNSPSMQLWLDMMEKETEDRKSNATGSHVNAQRVAARDRFGPPSMLRREYEDNADRKTARSHTSSTKSLYSLKSSRLSVTSSTTSIDSCLMDDDEYVVDGRTRLSPIEEY